MFRVLAVMLCLGAVAQASPKCDVTKNEIDAGKKLTYVGECVDNGYFDGGDYCGYHKFTLALAFQSKKIIILTDSCSGSILHKETVLEDSQARESFTDCGASKTHCEESRTIYLMQKGS